MTIKNKTAVSLMLSYVLLVVMAISLSVGVYSWLKFYATGAEHIEKCPEDVSLIIWDYTLLADKQIEITVKNKGLFNISGYYIKGTDNKNQESWFNLKDIMGASISGAVEGTYLFSAPFPPNAENTNTFSYNGLSKLEKIEIEPFRIQERTLTKKKNIILCDSAIITQEIIEYGCDSGHLDLCRDATNCTAAGGYWYGYACYSISESFNPIFLESLVSWWKFDESDGGIASDSKDGNTGNIYGNTRLLMRFDEGSGNIADDKSAYDNDGTITGATWTGSGCQSGSCLSFDGVDDYVNVGNDASLNFSSGDFTYSAWIKTSASNVNKRIIAHDGNMLNNKALIVDSSGANIDFWCRDASGNAIVVQGSININDSQWHYVVGVRKGSTGYVYIDGNPDGSATNATGSCDGNVNTFIGARNYSAGPLPFNGSIDEVAIYSRALSQSEITEHFTAGRAKFIERVPGKSGNAISFDGIDDYVNITIALPTSFSVGAWFKTNSTSGRTIVYRGTDTGSGETFLIDMDNSGGVRAGIRNTVPAWNLTSFYGPYNNGEFHYAIFTYDAPTNNISLYIDGVLKESLLFTGIVNDVNPTFRIGSRNPGTSFFNGSIDEVMIFNQALSQENITSIYQYYTG